MKKHGKEKKTKRRLCKGGCDMAHTFNTFCRKCIAGSMLDGLLEVHDFLVVQMCNNKEWKSKIERPRELKKTMERWGLLLQAGPSIN